MKKKIGAIFMAGVMACTVAATLGLAGCGASGGSAGTFEMPEGGFDVNKPVTISFYHTMGQTLRDKLDYQIAEFNKLFPNITVKQSKLGTYDDINGQIKTEIIGGNQPNITYCYGDHVADYNRSNAVLVLNDFLPGGAYENYKITLQSGEEYNLGMTQEEEDMFIEGFYNEGKQFGDGSKMYMLPFAKSTEVLYYNETYFLENGYEVPTTWEEMWTLCGKIKAAETAKAKEEGKENTDCIPLGYDSEANWFITMCKQLGTPYTQATGAPQDRFQFNTPENRAFVADLKEKFDLGYFTTQELNNGSYTSSLFTAQTCFMCIGSTAGGQYQKPPLQGTEYAFNVGIAQIPQVDPAHPYAISQGPSVCIFNKKDPQEVLASWLLVKYLTTNVEFQADFSIDSGYMPPLKEEIMTAFAPYKTELDKKNGTDHLAALAADMCLKNADAYFTSPAFLGSSQARQQVGSLMTAVLGGTDINTAFSDAVNRCVQYLT